MRVVHRRRVEKHYPGGGYGGYSRGDMGHLRRRGISEISYPKEGTDTAHDMILGLL